MKAIFSSRDLRLIFIAFILSRIIISFFSIHLNYQGLLSYWQYLDVYTLQHNLLKGIWYNHAQPPVFNLFLGIVLKIAGSQAQYVFIVLLKLISLANTLLIYSILKQLTRHQYLPLIISLIYLLSPATILFENELFYTSFISIMLLISAFFLLRLTKQITGFNATGFFIPLIGVCLTRSIYHLLFLLCLAIIVILYHKKREGLSTIVVSAVLSLLLVGSWYVKNYIIFDSFSTSSWMGMNIARNVFHDVPQMDSTKIESIEPFSKIPQYKNFISDEYKQKYAGLNDRDLIAETKNDTFLNANSTAYLEISRKYMAASKQQISRSPVSYLKNVLQSSIIFFAPATRYPLIEEMAKKIKYYDLLYSFNLSHFAEGKQQRRIALALSALPKLLLYVFVFLMMVRNWIRKKEIPVIQLFASFIIIYIFSVSSFFEHYENMRFRFEVEPLFMVLFAMVISEMLNKRQDLTTADHAN